MTDATAPPAAVDQAPADRDPVADALEEFAAFLVDADAALEDARRRREAAPAEVAAWSEARRRERAERLARAGWADDDRPRRVAAVGPSAVGPSAVGPGPHGRHDRRTGAGAGRITRAEAVISPRDGTIAARVVCRAVRPTPSSGRVGRVARLQELPRDWRNGRG